MKKLYIKWRDSRQLNGWIYLDEPIEESCVIVSIGYLIKETDIDYVLALSVDVDKTQANGINVIPKCSVIEIKPI